MTKGGRNLVIMGIAAVIVATATTSVALAIYHNSGDIYLDRSRPGYLPDKTEIEENEPEEADDYKFDKNGAVTEKVLDEYLKNLKLEAEALEVYKNAYSADELGDSKLGL